MRQPLSAPRRHRRQISRFPKVFRSLFIPPTQQLHPETRRSISAAVERSIELTQRSTPTSVAGITLPILGNCAIPLRPSVGSASFEASSPTVFADRFSANRFQLTGSQLRAYLTWCHSQALAIISSSSVWRGFQPSSWAILSELAIRTAGSPGRRVTTSTGMG